VIAPGGDAGGGGGFATLFQLPLPGGLLLSGGLLGGLAFVFLLRRRQRQHAPQSQPAAPAAQAEADAWPQPAAPAKSIAPATAAAPPLVGGPDPTSAPQPAAASDLDSLFLLAAVRLAPEGVAVDELLHAAPTDDAPIASPPAAGQPPAAEDDLITEAWAPASPAAEAAGPPAGAPVPVPVGAILEPEASATAAQASQEQAAGQEQATPEEATASNFRYRLGEPLGPGVAGTLYYAEAATESRDPKAIKFFSSRYFGHPGVRKRFLQHARSLTLLEDPHLVRVEEAGMYEQRGYLARPYLSGGSLADRLETPLTLRAAWRYLRPLAKVLDYLHECQVLHLHLTPENVLFDEADQLRVSEAGFVSLLMELAALNGSSFLVPPSSAIAPEQQAGEPDWRSDLYSLGVLLYQMLAGRDALSAHGDQPPRPPFLRALRPNLPMALEDVLAQAMAENPGERYQSAEALAWAFYAAVGPTSSARIRQETPE
jgi:hypothetical protein